MLLVAVPASAHERKKVGKVAVEVGFGTEPAYAGELNSVQLVVSQAGNPVTDVKGMKVQVTAASAPDQRLDLGAGLAPSEAAARQARDDARQARALRLPASRSGCWAWLPVGSQRGEGEPKRAAGAALSDPTRAALSR